MVLWLMPPVPEPSLLVWQLDTPGTRAPASTAGGVYWSERAGAVQTAPFLQ